MNKLIFLQLEIKRKIKLLPHIILGTLALSLVVGAAAFCASKMVYGKNKVAEKKQVIFSSQDDSEITKLIVSSLCSTPSITNICNVLQTDYEKALEMVRNKNTISSIIIPKDFMNSLMEGTNYSIDIYFSSTRSIFTLIITELSKAAQTSLQSAQAGIYTLHDYYYENNASEYESEANEDLNIIYLSRALSRGNFFEHHKVSATGHISMTNYYFASAILLVLLLLGCVFILKTKDTDRIISIKLKQKGIGAFSQTIIHVISTFIVLYIIFILGTTGIFILNKYADIGFNIKLFCMTAYGIVITLCCSAIICFISNIFTNKYSAILLHFVSVLIMSFITGAFIPSIFLPESIRNIAHYMPTTYLIKSIRNVLTGDVILSTIAELLFITVVSIIMAALLSAFRYRKNIYSGRRWNR